MLYTLTQTMDKIILFIERSWKLNLVVKVAAHRLCFIHLHQQSGFFRGSAAVPIDAALQTPLQFYHRYYPVLTTQIPDQLRI